MRAQFANLYQNLNLHFLNFIKSVCGVPFSVSTASSHLQGWEDRLAGIMLGLPRGGSTNTWWLPPLSFFFFFLTYVIYYAQQAASLEKVLKEQQQQQQLELERAWDQERDVKATESASPIAEQRVQEHSPPPTTDTQKPVITSVPVSQVFQSDFAVPSPPPKLSAFQTAGTGSQMMPSPVPGLHHMQQLLQQHVLNPNQLQQLMKHHSLFQQQQQVLTRIR